MLENTLAICVLGICVFNHVLNSFINLAILLVVGRAFHILCLTAKRADLCPSDDLNKEGTRSFVVEDLRCLDVYFRGIRSIKYRGQYCDGI